MKLVCKGCLYVMEHHKSRISNKWLCNRCNKPFIPEGNTPIIEIGEK